MLNKSTYPTNEKDRNGLSHCCLFHSLLGSEEGSDSKQINYAITFAQSVFKKIPRGLTLPKKAYEISKSLDFMEDFGISTKISRFHLRFPDFS